MIIIYDNIYVNYETEFPEIYKFVL